MSRLDDLSELLLGSASAGESDMWIGSSFGMPGLSGRRPSAAAWPGHGSSCLKKVMYLASSRVGSLHKKRVRVVNQASMLLPNSTTSRPMSAT